MIVLEWEENFKIKRVEFSSFEDKDKWFKDNPFIWDFTFSLECSSDFLNKLNDVKKWENVKSKYF